jgi:hypothetical protein
MYATPALAKKTHATTHFMKVAERDDGTASDAAAGVAGIGFVSSLLAVVDDPMIAIVFVFVFVVYDMNYCECRWKELQYVSLSLSLSLSVCVYVCVCVCTVYCFSLITMLSTCQPYF